MSDADFIAEFERTGEATVRRNLAAGRYKPGRAALAADWIATIDRSEQRSLARSDNEANWAAVKVARRANVISGIALGIAVLALIVAGWDAWIG